MKVEWCLAPDLINACWALHCKFLQSHAATAPIGHLHGTLRSADSPATGKSNSKKILECPRQSRRYQPGLLCSRLLIAIPHPNQTCRCEDLFLCKSSSVCVNSQYLNCETRTSLLAYCYPIFSQFTFTRLLANFSRLFC